MTETKETLQTERANLAARSLELASILATPHVDQGTNALNHISSLETGQVHRHKTALDDAIYVIDQRLQLIELRAQQVEQDKRDEKQRQADLAEAEQHQQEHEQALENAAKLKAESLKADEPLPPADPVE